MIMQLDMNLYNLNVITHQLKYIPNAITHELIYIMIMQSHMNLYIMIHLNDFSRLENALI